MRKILLTIIIAGLLVMALSVPAFADRPPVEPGAIGEYMRGLPPGAWGDFLNHGAVPRFTNPPSLTVLDEIVFNILY